MKELTGLVFNQSLIFDDLTESFQARYNLQEVITKDVSVGSGNHHGMSNLTSMMYGLDHEEYTELFNRPSHDCHGVSEMVCALNETYFLV